MIALRPKCEQIRGILEWGKHDSERYISAIFSIKKVDRALDFKPQQNIFEIIRKNYL